MSARRNTDWTIRVLLLIALLPYAGALFVGSDGKVKYNIGNAAVYDNGRFVLRDFSYDDMSISGVINILDDYPLFVFPGFADVHVHFREPGFSYKETILSGTMAESRGGYSHVCAMPNLNPVPDSYRNLSCELEAIEKRALINVIPYGSITAGEKGEILSDMESMSDYVCAFSDDGRGVQSDDIMLKAMLRAKSLGKIICAHCEDNSLLGGGYIHSGEYAKLHNHIGISSVSEWKQLERDIKLVSETGCKYHACHISTKESVQLIREAKAKGLDVTCETAPHYLTLTDMDIIEDGRFKMNPPLRSKSDRDALIEGIMDGTIDIIATDHAPHSAEEKSRGLEKSVMGVVGLETAFPIMYTHFVKTGIISLEKLVELMSVNPKKRFNLKGDMSENFTVFDLNNEYAIDSSEFLSKGKSTPFEGREVFGRCKLTVVNGNTVWSEV